MGAASIAAAKAGRGAQTKTILMLLLQEEGITELLQAPGKLAKEIAGMSGTRNLGDNLSDLRAQVQHTSDLICKPSSGTASCWCYPRWHVSHLQSTFRICGDRQSLEGSQLLKVWQLAGLPSSGATPSLSASLDALACAPRSWASLECGLHSCGLLC